MPPPSTPNCADRRRQDRLPRGRAAAANMDLEADLGIDSRQAHGDSGRRVGAPGHSAGAGRRADPGGRYPDWHGRSAAQRSGWRCRANPCGPGGAPRAGGPRPDALASGIAKAALVDQPAGGEGTAWLSGRVVLVVHDGGARTDAIVAALSQTGAVPVTLDLWPGADELPVESDERHHLVLTEASDAALAARPSPASPPCSARVQGLVMLLPTPPDSAASHCGPRARARPSARGRTVVLDKAQGTAACRHEAGRRARPGAGGAGAERHRRRRRRGEERGPRVAGPWRCGCWTSTRAWRRKRRSLPNSAAWPRRRTAWSRKSPSRRAAAGCCAAGGGGERQAGGTRSGRAWCWSPAAAVA